MQELTMNAQKNKLNFIRVMVIFIGISGCFSVLFGAWFAHDGQTLADIEKSNISTALQYQFIHTLALFICLTWLKQENEIKVLVFACVAFALGIICFSGGIYIKTLSGFSAVGKITPFGGVMLAIGWFFIAFSKVKLAKD